MPRSLDDFFVGGNSDETTYLVVRCARSVPLVAGDRVGTGCEQSQRRKQPQLPDGD
jgi:hypothetical protein